MWRWAAPQTVKPNLAGLLLLVVPGGVLGAAAGCATGWPIVPSALVAILVILTAAWTLDRRRHRSWVVHYGFTDNETYARAVAEQLRAGGIDAEAEPDTPCGDEPPGWGVRIAQRHTNRLSALIAPDESASVW